jgi:HK97 family phage major capsid protein
MNVNRLTSAVLAAFRPAHFVAFNDAAALESLQDKLLELKDGANNIQARADAEKRELSEDETKEIEQIFAAFENTEAEIERRNRIGDINARVATPNPRKSAPEPLPGDEGDEPQPAARPQARSRSVPAQPRNSADTGKWGFRSQGEYLKAVIQASQRGATPDPRLIANAAPGSYGSEGVGQDGGFAVPPDFRTNIMTKVMGEDSLLSLTDQQTSSSNAISFPADETTPWQATGGIQAYWEVEGGQKTPSKPSLVDKLVKLNKCIALVPLTDELLEDAPAMSSYVNRKAPEKINFKVNDAILNGTGIGMPLGILQSPGTVVVAAEGSQTADTVVLAHKLYVY